MALFALCVIGAGDAKFYAGLAAWFALTEGLRLFVAVAMTGAVVLLVWAAIRRLRGERVFTRDAQPENGVPFGVAIASGTLLLALSSLAPALLSDCIAPDGGALCRLTSQEFPCPTPFPARKRISKPRSS